MSMDTLLTEVWKAWHSNNDWMAWNLFLASIPLALSFWLFRSKSGLHSGLWWIGLAVFILFLPNAPYLLTDVIHLIQAIRRNYSVWTITLVVIPQHLLVILTGFEAYVLSVMNLGEYLQRRRLGKLISSAELITHALCAFGIYLGRFQRFNSWDLVAQPNTLAKGMINDLTSKGPLLVMAVTFVVLTVFYWMMKQITLGIMIRMRHQRSGSAASG
ncbi:MULTISPECIES: DUF1361 domain-containing protein [Moorena]|nr:DUF1361 domain-containing protein [Moorena producens]